MLGPVSADPALQDSIAQPVGDAGRTVLQKLCGEAPPGPQPLSVAQDAPLGILSETELAAVKDLRSRVAASLAGWREEHGEAVVEESTAHTDDFTLHRFLVSRPDSVEEALEMFSQAMQWRVDRGVGRLFTELHPRADVSGARHTAARQYFYGGYGGVTRTGVPYFVERLGMADLAGMARQPRLLDLMFDAYVAHLETIFRSVRVHAAAVGQFSRCVVIIDCAGFSFSTLRHIGIIKKVSKIGPPNFPEGSSKVLVVNAPVVISAAWSVISPMLPKRTQAKVTICSSWTSQSVINELIDRTELPEFLGGTRPPELDLIARAESVPTEVVDLPESEPVSTEES